MYHRISKDFLIDSMQLLNYFRHSFLVSGKKLCRKLVKPTFSSVTDFFQKLSAFHRTVKLLFFMKSLVLKTYKDFFLDDVNVFFSVFYVM